MIVGRENSSKELDQQEYMEQKIQPVISKIVLNLLETKPENPVPQLYSVLDNMADEAHQEKLEQQRADGNLPLTDEEYEEYLVLKEQHATLKREVDMMLSQTH